MSESPRCHRCGDWRDVATYPDDGLIWCPTCRAYHAADWPTAEPIKPKSTTIPPKCSLCARVAIAETLDRTRYCAEHLTDVMLHNAMSTGEIR